MAAPDLAVLSPTISGFTPFPATSLPSPPPVSDCSDDKLARIRADNPPARPDPHQPGGGVAAGYGARCVADGINVSYSLLEFLRDTEMVRDERSLDLREWVDVHDKAVSLIPLAAALEHNAWFTHLTISGATRPKFLFLLAGILASNSTLEVIAFSDCGFKQGLTAVCETFVTRAGRLALHDISLAGNPGLKTKDFVGFAGDGLGALPSLSHLDLSRNDLPPPVFSALFQGAPFVFGLCSGLLLSAPVGCGWSWLVRLVGEVG